MNCDACLEPHLKDTQCIFDMAARLVEIFQGRMLRKHHPEKDASDLPVEIHLHTLS